MPLVHIGPRVEAQASAWPVIHVIDDVIALKSRIIVRGKLVSRGKAKKADFVPNYESGRDDAIAEDIALRPWKAIWPRYIRVHHAEFVAGAMANGASLNALMEALASDAFAATQGNAQKGKGNLNPRRAYLQQAAVRLTDEGHAWVGERLQAAFDEHGAVSQDVLATLDWPAVP